MKESITKFDLEAAFKALDEIEVPKAAKGIKANRPALTEIFSRKSKFDALFEDYYDINNTTELTDAKEARDAEIAKAKLARIEKIVDLDAESPEDLLTSYVGKYIIQCPQCMTLFYKKPEDVEESEDDPTTVNVSEVCQHCGNESGYTLIGKVGAAEEEPEESTEEPTEEPGAEDEELDFEIENDEAGEVDAESTEEASEGSEEDFDLDADLAALGLDLENEEEPEEEKKEESFFGVHGNDQLVEQLNESSALSLSDAEFRELINSPEFRKPITASEASAMLHSLGESADQEDTPEDDLTEEVEVNGETFKYAVVEADGTFAGGPCTTEEEARQLMAQKNGRILVKLEGLADLDEGAFDKIKTAIKDKIEKHIDTKTLKSREEKADWLLKNARIDYNKVDVDENGEFTDEDNIKFKTFLVLGFKDKYTNGKPITMAPTYTNKDLVFGMDKPVEKGTYREADRTAKGWSMQQGNGPAFILLAKDEQDTKPVFLCEYFEGAIDKAQDQLINYFETVKKSLQGVKLKADGNKNSNTQETEPEEKETTSASKEESLKTFMSDVDELQDAKLESLISNTLVESYGNVAGFRISDCAYTNKKFLVEGTVVFTSGNTRKTTYTFTEALNTENGKIQLQGFNEKLGLDKQFTLTGYTDKPNKTFITESFTRTRK